MICLDTNVIYHFLFRTELTDEAERVIKANIVAGMSIPMTVINELLYTVGMKVVMIKYGIRGKWSFKRFIGSKGFPKEAIEIVNNFIEDFNINVIIDYQDRHELIDTMMLYRLAPNDAQIALTCKYHRIGIIATFDGDFRRVPWLKVIP